MRTGGDYIEAAGCESETTLHEFTNTHHANDYRSILGKVPMEGPTRIKVSCFYDGRLLHDLQCLMSREHVEVE